MTPRILAEIELVKKRFTTLDFNAETGWGHIPEYGSFPGWTPNPLPVCFQILSSHPGTRPYGFYVPAGTLYNGERPQNYTDPASNQPPCGGSWAFFSWEADPWQPAADIHSGSNLYNWVLGFADRLRGGL